MSQFESASFAPPTVPGDMPEKKSSWPVVIGVIAIVFGALGALGGCINAASPLMVNAASSMMEQAAGSSSDPAAAQQVEQMKAIMDASKKYQVATVAVGVVTLLTGVLLLTGGIGLCMRATWSRPVCLFWSLLKVVVVFAGAGVGYLTMKAQMDAMQQLGGAPAGTMAMGTGFGIIGVVIGVAWGLILPIFMLIWFNRAPVKAEVRNWAAMRDQRV